MKKALTLLLVFKIANAFFFFDPTLNERPTAMFDNRFWKNLGNLEDMLKSPDRSAEDEDTAVADSDEQVDSIRRPQDFFTLFNSMASPAKPWWMGKNVCETKEETDLTEADSDANSTSMFGLSSRMETCAASPGRYTCTTTVREAGRHVRTTVKYECCHGFALERQKCVAAKIANLTEAVREAAPEFATMLEASGIMEQLKDSSCTVFVTPDQTINDLRESFDQMNRARRRRAAENEPQTVEVPHNGRATGSEMAPALNSVLKNHVVTGIYQSADFSNNMIVDSMSGHKLRMNVYPSSFTSPVLTVNCKRVIKADKVTDKGLLHVVDGVLKPVERTVAQIILEDDRFTIFRSMLEEADLLDRLSNDTVTVFAPTDDAFNALPNDFRSTHSSCSGAIARHHVTPHLLCLSGLVDTWSILTLSGERLRMELFPEGPLINDKTKITKSDVVGTNGVVHVIDSVLLPDSSRNLNEVFEARNLTTFQKLLSEAGLSETSSDITWFVPREEAFADPEVQKTLEELRADPIKLREMLLYHSTKPQIQLTTLENDQNIITGAGDLPLHFNIYSDGPAFSFLAPRVTVNCARARATDNKACGANVHEVERLLIPPKANIFDYLKDKSDFSILNKVIEKAGISDDLMSSSPITLLAPTDDAFNDLPARVLNALLANETQARQVLEKHILSEGICCHGVAGHSWLWTQHVTTKDGSRLQARRDGLGNVHFGRTRVTQCDQLATNGIVHTVSQVMVPRESQKNPFAPFLNVNGWRLQGHNNPNVDVMLFGI